MLRGVLTPGLENIVENIVEKSFFGVSFDIQGVPVDVLSIYLLNSYMQNFSILIVDEFLKLNGTNDLIVNKAKNQFLEVFEKLQKLYGYETKLLFCSDFMHLIEYNCIFDELKQEIGRKELTNDVLQTVPENRRSSLSALDYPAHEFACVSYLQKKGYGLKIGPSREKQYDQIMKKLGIEISFAYLLDAFALGCKTADSVVHYVPGSKGPNNGQRILFGEDERKIKLKLQQGCDEALRYYCKIASVSGFILGKEYLQEAEINSFYGKPLRSITIKLFFDNVVNPFKEVM